MTFRTIIAQAACLSITLSGYSPLRAQSPPEPLPREQLSAPLDSNARVATRIVSSAQLSRLLDQLERDPVDAIAVDGKPRLGVSVADSALGVEVTAIEEGGAADRAGLITGDDIISIDEADIETPADLVDALAEHPLSRPLKLSYLRNNKSYVREIRFKAETAADESAEIRTGNPAISLEDAHHEALHEQVDRLNREVAVLRKIVRILAAQQLSPEQ